MYTLPVRLLRKSAPFFFCKSTMAQVVVIMASKIPSGISWVLPSLAVYKMAGLVIK